MVSKLVLGKYNLKQVNELYKLRNINNYKLQLLVGSKMYDSNQLDSFRYAQMQSSILNKTGVSTSSLSSSKINLKNKFGSIEQSMNSVQNDLRKLVADTNETMRYARQLATDVADRELNDNKNKLLEEVKKLDKTVKYGIAESQKRSQKIWNDCKNRIKTTQILKNSMTSLRERIGRLENTLGYHSVSEKVL